MYHFLILVKWTQLTLSFSCLLVWSTLYTRLWKLLAIFPEVEFFLFVVMSGSDFIFVSYILLFVLYLIFYFSHLWSHKFLPWLDWQMTDNMTYHIFDLCLEFVCLCKHSAFSRGAFNGWYTVIIYIYNANGELLLSSFTLLWMSLKNPSKTQEHCCYSSYSFTVSPHSMSSKIWILFLMVNVIQFPPKYVFILLYTI